jgi:AhpC/TSA family
MTKFLLCAFRARHLPLVACLFAAFAPSLSAQQAPVCAASPEVQAALNKIPRNQSSGQTTYQFVVARQTALRNLMQRFPDDVFVESAYIGAMQYYDSDMVKVAAEYKARHEEHPDNTEITYLYATTLVDRDTPQAIKLLDEVLEREPNFNVAHLDFVTIYLAPNFLDKEKAIAHERDFLGACPTALQGYYRLQQIDDKELIAQSVPKLQQIIEGRTDSDALRGYSTLWSLEFKAKPPSEYEALRKQVAADVGRIRALNRTDLSEWWSALSDGYKLANDPKDSDWANNERKTRLPYAWEWPSRDEWLKVHPQPNEDAPFDERQAYDRALLKKTDDWIKQRPDLIDVWYWRLSATEDLDEVPASEVATCVSKILQLAQADAGPNPIDSNTRFSLAEAMYKRKLDPQQQVEMARKALEQLDSEMKQPPLDLYFSKKELDDQTFYQTDSKAQGFFYETDGYVRLKQADNARTALVQLEETLRALKSQINEKDSRRDSYLGRESTYWNAMAHFAQLQGRKLDAMAYYESALLDRLDSESLPAPGEKDNLGHDAHDLWASLGGTDEGWKSWYGDRATALANQSHLSWETAQDPLPPFQLTDLQGKTWQLADLKGKVVFLNFWASW